MNDSDISDLARMLPVPDARDFHAGRQQTLKEHLMTEFRIAEDYRAGLSPVRRARLRPQIMGAAAAAAAVAVAVGVTLPASHPSASHPARGPAAKLAACVTRQADGNIQVTFREMRDAAGLQRVLRADGVPASVTFPRPENPACQNLPMQHPHWRPGLTRAQAQRGSPVYFGPGPYALIIRPAALPSGVGLTLFGSGRDVGEPYDQLMGAPVGLSVGLVKASPQCTGS
jgi:hypothetical protein